MNQDTRNILIGVGLVFGLIAAIIGWILWQKNRQGSPS